MDIQSSNRPANPQRFTSYSSRSRVSPDGTKKTFSPTLIIVIFSLIILSLGAFFILTSKGKEDSQGEESATSSTTTESTKEEDETDQTQEEEANETIDTSDKEEDGEAEDGASSEDFSQSDQQVGDKSIKAVTIVSLDHKAYDGFLRIVFELDSDEASLVTSNLNTSSNLISLKFKGISSDNSIVSTGNGLDLKGSVVSTIFHEVTSEENTSRYSIGVKKATGFYLHTLSDPTRVVLDIQEQDVENGDSEEFSFSQESQSFEGNAGGNVITISGLSYSNQGSVFRIIFRLGTVGTGSIPAASAQIVDFEGGKAVKLVMSNMSSDWAAQGNYDEDYTDSAVTGMKGSFASNTSTYYIRINGSRDYQLYYRTAPAQLIVDVKR
ncbi:MAG: hypothetical protein PHS44_05805 [Candidatus Dojkabacteria bacterium]|nr:hypothetical protein [Candidatus Dojkabacteria bacterium]